MFNWPGNDYREASIIDRPAREVAAALQDAKRASLGFLHWVQTEAPAEGGRLGAPELELRPDIMGSADGLAKFPYIRECRRIKALRTVVEQDVSAHFQQGPGAAHFEDFSRRRLVSDRHPSCRPGRRRHQLPDAPVSDSARRAHPGTHPKPDRCCQEHRHDPHHQWLLSSASRRVEHWGGCRSARSLLPHRGEDSGRDMPGQAPQIRLPAQPHARGCAVELGGAFGRAGCVSWLDFLKRTGPQVSWPARRVLLAKFPRGCQPPANLLQSVTPLSSRCLPWTRRRSQWHQSPDVRFGSEADAAAALAHRPICL